jgi:hypothetical protein
LEKGDHTTPAINRERLDTFLLSHLIEPSLLRADNFEAFMEDRQTQLLRLIEKATGKTPQAGAVPEDDEDLDTDTDTAEAALTMTAA